MKLVSMKRPKSKKSNTMEAVPMDYDGEKYPYSLRIRLEKEQISKIPGVKECQVGDTVMLQAKGKVTEVTAREGHSGKARHTIEIQMQDIGISKKKALKDMGMKEYNEAREAGQVK